MYYVYMGRCAFPKIQQYSGFLEFIVTKYIEHLYLKNFSYNKY